MYSCLNGSSYFICNNKIIPMDFFPFSQSERSMFLRFIIFLRVRGTNGWGGQDISLLTHTDHVKFAWPAVACECVCSADICPSPTVTAAAAADSAAGGEMLTETCRREREYSADLMGI